MIEHDKIISTSTHQNAQNPAVGRLRGAMLHVKESCREEEDTAQLFTSLLQKIRMKLPLPSLLLSESWIVPPCEAEVLCRCAYRR